MSLEQEIMSRLKEAMKSKDENALRGLRAIKAEIIKAKTESGAGGKITEEGELKLLQKMAKQRRDSLEIFEKQGRQDLADKEKSELEVIAAFLPEQLSEDKLKAIIEDLIRETGATGPADMGKVMGVATKKLNGQADGKAISTIVKSLLSK